MNKRKDIRRKWIAALLSGKYEQTRGMLHRKDDGYCCLGVLTEIVMGPGCWRDEDHNGALCVVRFPGETCFPSPGVLKAAGIDHEVARMLAEANDGDLQWNGRPSRPKTFKQIAKLIEDLEP